MNSEETSAGFGADEIKEVTKRPISQAIEAVLRQVLNDDENVRAVIISGSYAGGMPDAASDLDVIQVISQGSQCQFYQKTTEIELDVYCDSLPSLEAQLYTLRKNNNNFLLNSLVKGIVYIDYDGSGKRLIDGAKALWRRGPESLSRREKEARLAALLRLRTATKHLVHRAERSREDRFLAEVRCGDLFKHAVYDYMCFAKRWTSNLKETLSWIKRDDEPFGNLCQTFIGSDSVEDRFISAEAMVNRVADLECRSSRRAGHLVNND